MSSQRKVVRKHATRARHGRDDHVCSGIPPPAPAGTSFKPCGHNLTGTTTACGPPGDGKPLDLTQLSSEQRSKLESFLKSSGFGPLPKAGQTLDAATMRKLAQHMRAAAAMPNKTTLRSWGDNEKNPKDGLVRQAVTSSKRDDVKNLLEEGGDVDEAEPKTLCTPLMLAVRDGSKEIVQLLLDYDADVTRRDKDGRTAIMEACAAGRDDLVQLLIDHGSCVADTDNSNWNSLTHAAAHGQVRCAQTVIRHLKYDKETQEKIKEVAKKDEKKKKTKDKAKVTDVDDSDEAECPAESALPVAAKQGQFEFVKWYLSQKDQFKVIESEIQSACSKSCYSKRIDLLRLLIEEHGAKLNPEPNTGALETPLCAASAAGDADMVRYLLQRGARVNDTDANGFTPLMRACNEGNANIVPILLHHGANVNAQNIQYENWTPLCFAILKGNVEIVQTLVTAHANVNLGGTPPLLLAVSFSNAEVVDYLLSKGANPVQKSLHGDTCLTFAADVGNLEWVKKFHALGCDVDSVGDKGHTPLMKAGKKGALEIIEYLLDNGAVINRTSANNDCTALSLACSKGWIRIIEFLLERGASRTTKLKDNVTPLLEAVKSGNSEAADLVMYHQPLDAKFREQGNVGLLGLNCDHQAAGLAASAYMKAMQQNPVNEIYMNYKCSHCDGHHPDPFHTTSDNSSDEDDEEDEDDVDEDEDDEDQSGMDDDDDMHEECESEDEDDELRDEDEEYTSGDDEDGDVQKDSENYDLPEILATDLADLDFPVAGPYDIKEGLDADIDFIRNQLAHFTPQSFEFRILNAMLRKAEQLQKSLPNHTPEELRRRFSEEISRWQNELQSNSNVDDLMDKLVTEPSLGREEDLGGEPDEPTLADIASILQANPNAIDYSSVLFQRGEISPADARQLTEGEPKRGVTLSPDGKYIIMTNSSNSSVTTPFGDFEFLQHIAAAANANPASLAQSMEHLPEDLARAMAEAKRNGVFNMEAFSTFLQGAKEDAKLLEEYHNATRVPASFNFSAPPPASLTAAPRPVEKSRKFPVKKPTLGLGIPKMPPLHDPNGKVPRTPEPTPDDTSEDGFQGSDDVPAADPKSLVLKHMSATMRQTAKKTLRNTRDVATNVTSTAPPPKKPALVDVDQQQESDASTALIQAAIRGNAKIIAMLCDAGAKPNHKDKKGWTALGYAVERGHKEAVKELCEHGAEMDCVMDTNQAKRDSALTIACYNGRTEIVRILLDHKANIEHRNSNDYTPLCVACLNGHHRVAQMLIQRGADINARGTKLGIAPLMLAAMNGHTTIVKLLIENNADVNQCIETNRNTALTLACFQGRTECVRVLVEKGANLEWRSKNGLNAMMEAANGGFYEIGKILVESGAEVNCAPVPSTKDTPLTIAAEKGHAKFVQLLIDNGAAVNIRNKKGCSPLWLACQNGHLDCVRALVASYKADVDSRDNRQMSCILTAFKRGHENIVKILVDHIQCYPSEEEMTRYCKDVKLNGNSSYLLTVYARCKKAILDAKHKKEAEADAKARSLLEELDQQQKTKEGQRAKKRDKKKQKKKTGKNDDEDDSVTGVSNARTNESEPNSQSPSASPSRSASAIRQEAARRTAPTAPSTKINGHPPPEEDDDDEDDSKSKKKKKKKGKKAAKAPELVLPTQLPPPPPVEDKPVPSQTAAKPVAEKTKAQELVTAASKLLKHVQLHETAGIIAPKPASKGKPVAPMPLRDVPVPVVKPTVTPVAPAKRAAPTLVIQPPPPPPPPVVEPAVESDDDDARDNDQGVDVSADEWVQQRSKSKISSQAALHGDKHDPRRPSASTIKQEGWKEVVGRSKRFKVPTTAIARIIGKGGNNINAIRASTCAHIEIEKNKPGINDRLITVKGTSEAVAEAYHIIQTLCEFPDRDLDDLLNEAKRDSAELTRALKHNMQPAPLPTGPNIHPPKNMSMMENVHPVVKNLMQHHAVQALAEQERRHKPVVHTHVPTHSTQVFTNSQMHNRAPPPPAPPVTIPPAPSSDNYSAVLSSTQKRNSIHSTSSKESGQESSSPSAPRAASANIERDSSSPALSANHSATSSTSNRGSPSSLHGAGQTSIPTSVSAPPAEKHAAPVHRAVPVEVPPPVVTPNKSLPVLHQVPAADNTKRSPQQLQPSPAKAAPDSIFGTLYKDLLSERNVWSADMEFFAKDSAPTSIPSTTSSSYQAPTESRILRPTFESNNFPSPHSHPSNNITDLLNSYQASFPSPTRPSSLPQEPRLTRQMNGGERYGMNGFISPSAGYASAESSFGGYGNVPGLNYSNGYPPMDQMESEGSMWQNGYGFEEYPKEIDEVKLMGVAETLAQFEREQMFGGFQQRRVFMGNGGYMEPHDLGFGDAGPDMGPMTGSRLMKGAGNFTGDPSALFLQNSGLGGNYGWNSQPYAPFGSNISTDESAMHGVDTSPMASRTGIRSNGTGVDNTAGNMKTSPQYSRDRQAF